MSNSKSDLPYGGQFTPTQTDLPQLLGILERNDGDLDSIHAGIKSTFFATKGDPNKLAYNTVWAIQSYGLIDDDGHLTDLGQELCGLSSSPEQLYGRFAQHILLNLKGLDLIQVIQDMEAAGHTINLETIHRELRQRGIEVPSGSMYVSAMRMWLEMAGVFNDRYDVDTHRIEALIGASEEQIEALRGLSEEQRAYLRALALLGGDGPFNSHEIAEYAHNLYGVEFSEKALPKQVLYPLEETGYLSVEKATEGRGAKPHQVTPSEGLESDVLIPILQAIADRANLPFRELLRKSFAEILEEMNSDNTHTKGKALEYLSAYLMRLLDLEFVSWRRRGRESGGAEVDVLVEGKRLIFSRWQIQCKNTDVISNDDVAREVGLVPLLKSSVILVVGAGNISPKAREYAKRILEDTNMHIAFLDGADLEAIAENPVAIVHALNREADRAMKIKKLEI